MISNSSLSAAESEVVISVTSGAILPASLRTGTTMETAGVLAWFMVSGPLLPSQAAPVTHARNGTLARRGTNRASFLWGDEAAGNPLDACPGGPWQGLRDTVSIDDEAKAAPCKPVAHEQRAHAADKGAGDHVAQVMRIKHDPADCNDQCIDEHDRSQPRPEQPDGDRRRKGCRGMARRHAGVVRAPDPAPVQEWISLAAHIRAGPPNHTLDDGDEQARRCDRHEQKACAYGDDGQHEPAEPRQRR